LRAVDAAYKLDFNAKVDRVRAVNTRTGEPLPRIAPLRVALGVDFSMGGWQAGMDIERHSAARVAAGEFRSEGYTLTNARAAYRLSSAAAGPISTLIYARVNNVGNVLARPAASILREIAPLPGRQFELGVQLRF
jgi:iron complex outermembrane recepter protein